MHIHKRSGEWDVSMTASKARGTRPGVVALSRAMLRMLPLRSRAAASGSSSEVPSTPTERIMERITKRKGERRDYAAPRRSCGSIGKLTDTHAHIYAGARGCDVRSAVRGRR